MNDTVDVGLAVSWKLRAAVVAGSDTIMGPEASLVSVMPGEGGGGENRQFIKQKKRRRSSQSTLLAQHVVHKWVKNNNNKRDKGQMLILSIRDQQNEPEKEQKE